jgi:hypothetical protein
VHLWDTGGLGTGVGEIGGLGVSVPCGLFGLWEEKVQSGGWPKSNHSSRPQVIRFVATYIGPLDVRMSVKYQAPSRDTLLG